MGGNNMESLLMGGDDSSSGDSDDEVIQVGSTKSNVAPAPAPKPPTPAPAPATQASTTAVPAAIRSPAPASFAPAASVPAPAAQVAPAPAVAPAAPVPTAAAGGGAGPATQGSANQSQLARLKSLYSSQPRKTSAGSVQASTAPANTSSISTKRPSATIGGPPPQQQPGAVMQPPPQQRVAPPPVAPQQRMQPPQQQQQQAPSNPSSMPPMQHHQQQQQQQQRPGAPPVARTYPGQPPIVKRQMSSSALPNTQPSRSQQQPSPQQQIPPSVSRRPPGQQPPQATAQQQVHPRSQVPPTAPGRSPSASVGPPSHHTSPHHLQGQPGINRPPGDPFAPTPLHAIKQKNDDAAKRAAASASMNPAKSISHHSPAAISAPSSTHGPPGSSSIGHPSAPPGSAPSSSASRAQDRQAMSERELRRQKERFLMFTRVLMKYLEQKDPVMHQKAKAIIKDCAERNKRQERGYESVTASMRERLKTLVGDPYWKRAESYLKHFLEQKNKSDANKGRSSAPSGTPTLSQQRQPSPHQPSTTQPPLIATSSSHSRMPPGPLSASMPSPRAAPSASTARPDLEAKHQPPLKTAAPPIAAATADPSGKSTSGKKATSVKRKSVSSPRAPSQSASKTAAAPISSGSAPKEYSDLMEEVDHAIAYNWTTAGMLLPAKSPHLSLHDEQRMLLYGSAGSRLAAHARRPSTTLGGSNGKISTSMVSSFKRDWGKRNVVSARVAWARVRLRELTPTKAELQPLPGEVSTMYGTRMTNSWASEKKAEQDATLAMLSEGCQVYLKGIVEKAIHCARQRQNLDGIRLWHQQHVSSDSANKPPLSVRLGCDVSRQYAQVAGNAAMTCKRMEEALERRESIPTSARDLSDPQVLLSSTSMSELAMRPLLRSGVTHADYSAKRSFEEFGGKNASEPPLGRVPKQARLEVADFIMGSQMMAGSAAGRQHMTAAVGTSIFF